MRMAFTDEHGFHRSHTASELVRFAGVVFMAGAAHDWQLRISGKRRIDGRALAQAEPRSARRLDSACMKTVCAQSQARSIHVVDLCHAFTIAHSRHRHRDQALYGVFPAWPWNDLALDLST